MTVNEILLGLEQDGVRLALTPIGTVKAKGEPSAITKWTPIIQRHKPGIIAALQPAPPLHPGWQLTWRDGFGKLVGGWDEPDLGTVASCTWDGWTWRVRLTSGREVSLLQIVGVRKMREGKCIGAWNTRDHGLDGEGRR